MNKFYYLLILIFLLGFKSQSQTIDSTYCDSKSIQVNRLFKGQSVTSPCDTLFYMNKSTFKIFNDKYNAIKKEDIKALIKAYNDERKLYENRIDQQQSEYDSLYHKYDQLMVGSQTFVDKGNAKIDSINASLANSKEFLTNASTTLEELQKTIKKERRLSTLHKILAGFAGLGIGILVGVVAQ